MSIATLKNQVESPAAFETTIRVLVDRDDLKALLDSHAELVYRSQRVLRRIESSLEAGHAINWKACTDETGGLRVAITKAEAL